jgi:hypothetical protein
MSKEGIIDTKLLAAGQWFSPGTPASSTNKTDRHDITDLYSKILFKSLS